MSPRLLRMCGWLMVLTVLAMLSVTGLLLFTGTETGQTLITPASLAVGCSLAAYAFFKIAKRQEQLLEEIRSEMLETAGVIVESLKDHDKEQEKEDYYKDKTTVSDDVTDTDREKLWDITERHGSWQ